MMQEQSAQQQSFNEWESKWKFAKPFIEKAVKRQDLYSIDDIECRIRDGVFLLWVGKKSAMVTECIEFPQMKTMNLLFCGGNYQELESMIPSIVAFAKACGIKRLHGGGRLGWLRKISKELGFKSEYVISKDI